MVEIGPVDFEKLKMTKDRVYRKAHVNFQLGCSKICLNICCGSLLKKISFGNIRFSTKVKYVKCIIFIGRRISCNHYYYRMTLDISHHSV